MMSQQYYNHQDLITKFGSDATLGDVFSQLEDELKSSKEVVCQFKVNGLPLDEQGEKRLAAAKLDEVESLEVRGQQPTAILGDILISWSDQIPVMIRQNDELATQIRFKGVEGNLKSLVDLIDQSQLLVESIMSIDTVFPDFPIVKSLGWSAAQKQMAEGVGESIEAFQKKDYTWLADILEYDMGHSLQVWMELLERLKQDVTGTSAPGATP
jgi:hypothetical protein